MFIEIDETRCCRFTTTNLRF